MYYPLHLHTYYSFDGAGSPKRVAATAKRLGYKGVAITDHYNVNGVIPHYRACKEEGIQPILGMEANYQPIFAPPQEMETVEMRGKRAVVKKSKTPFVYNHITLLVKNKTGFSNLMKMVTAANERSFYYHPVVTDELLQAYHEGLIMLSGCIKGPLAQRIIHGQTDEAWERLTFYADLFEDDFYLEVMPIPAPGQREVNKQLELWGKLYGYPIVMTEDAHRQNREELKSFLIFQQAKRSSFDPDGGVDYSELFMHTEAQLLDLWCKLMDERDPRKPIRYMTESMHIAAKCSVEFEETIKMPVLSGIDDARETLEKLALQGAIKKKLIPEQGELAALPHDYLARLNHELEIIYARGAEYYMLMAYDLVTWAHENHIYMQSRGSAAGCLLAWFLGIHTTDPIKYGLSFERFLNPERPDLPDIDFDIADDKRMLVVEYAKRRYGGNAAQIATYGMYKSKSTLNKLETIIPFEEGDKKRLRDGLRKKLEYIDEQLVTLEDLLDVPDLAYIERKYGAVSAFWYIAGDGGQVAFIGQHAAGIVISAGKITDKMALQRIGSNGAQNYVTNVDMNGILEDVKVDALGLSTLTALELAERDAGITFSDILIDEQGFYDEDDIEHPEVMELFRKGDTFGFFQSEKQTPTTMYMQLRPHTIEELAYVNACNRPLPLKEKTFEALLASLVGDWQSTFLDRPIIYQEDVMHVCHDIAGMSWEQTFMVLKALKHYTVNDPVLEAIFVKGMVDHGYDEKESENLWQSMRRYLFVKSHAIVYSQIAGRQAYLKKRYPSSFYLSLLRGESDTDKRDTYSSDAIRHGVMILLAHVNGAAQYQKLVRGERAFLQEGLTVIPGVAAERAYKIEQERVRNGDYINLKDLTDRVPKAILNVGVLAALQERGATEFRSHVYMNRCRSYNKRLAEQPLIHPW